MLDLLLAPIDASRAHEVGFAVSWHGRAMVLGWGILAPLAVLIARFFKVLPGQDWPRELDNQTWWRSHWMGQSLVFVLSIFGLALVLPSDLSGMGMHGWLGYSVLVGMVLQVGLGLLRGSKGGPTAPAQDGSLRGHHYDMTPWRRRFEVLHKGGGYLLLLLGMTTIVFGLWQANAAFWMWCVIGLWWISLLVVFILFQRKGMAIDTYQAIWGDDPSHPGNQAAPPKWAGQRPAPPSAKRKEEETSDVRHDRGNQIRSH